MIKNDFKDDFEDSARRMETQGTSCATNLRTFAHNSVNKILTLTCN